MIEPLAITDRPPYGYNILLLIVPATFVAYSLWIHSSLEFFFGGIVDPTYAYYLNIVRVYSEFWPGVVEHPGIPLQMLGGMILFASSFFVDMPCSDANCRALYLLSNSETFIRFIYIVFIVIFFACLAIFGFAVRRTTRQLGTAVSAQMYLFVAPSTIYGLLPLAPEILLISLGLILAAILAPAVSMQTQGLRHPFGLGATIATAVFTKFTALPFALFFLLAKSRRSTILAIAGAVALTILWLPLVLNQLKLLTDFYGRFLQSKGLYGYIQYSDEIGNTTTLLNSMTKILYLMPMEVSTVMMLTFAAIAASLTKRRVPRLITLIIVASFLALGAMLRQPVPRYFLPMTPLLALGLAWLMIELRPSRRLSTAATLGFNLIPPAILATVLVSNLVSAKAWTAGLVEYHDERVAYEREVSRQGDCYLMRPSNQLTGLYFGAGWVRSDFIRSILNTENENFITYNGNGRRELFDFSGKLSLEEIKLKQQAIGKGLCAIFDDAWTIRLDEDFYEVLGHRESWTAVRVRQAIAP